MGLQRVGHDWATEQQQGKPKELVPDHHDTESRQIFWNKKLKDEGSMYKSVLQASLLSGGNKSSFYRIAVRIKTNHKYEYLMKKQIYSA